MRRFGFMGEVYGFAYHGGCPVWVHRGTQARRHICCRTREWCEMDRRKWHAAGDEAYAHHSSTCCGRRFQPEAVARPFEYLGIVLNDIVNIRVHEREAASLQPRRICAPLTRLVSGQLAAVIDVGNRIMRDHPSTRDRFVAIGGGKVVSLFTYDIAAAALIAEEAGAVVTDAFGHSLGSTPLLDSSEANLTSICAAATPELHRILLKAIERGSAELGRRLN